MSLQNQRILITGINGFVGRNLCRELSSYDAEIVGFVRNCNIPNEHVAHQYQVDITDRSLVRQLVQMVQPDVVIHLATNKIKSSNLSDYRISYETIFFGSLNLVEACQELANSPRFIYLGSCEEYGSQQVPFDEFSKELPITPYGTSKLAVTQLLQALAKVISFHSVILRPSVVYGPGQQPDMFLPSLISTLMAGKRFSMTAGEQTRDYVYVGDLVNAIISAMTSPNIDGKVINISSSMPIQIKQLALMTADLIGPGVEKLIDFGGCEYRQGEAMEYWANNSLAKEFLGWTPRVSLNEGLQYTVDFFAP